MSGHGRHIQTPLARARGLGSARSGVHHWLHERITSAALVPLNLWLVWAAVTMPDWSYAGFTTWLAQPVNAVLLLLNVILMFYHAALGVQVIIEDYVHCEGKKWFSLVLSHMLFFAGAVACIFAVLKVAFAVGM